MAELCYAWSFSPSPKSCGLFVCVTGQRDTPTESCSLCSKVWAKVLQVKWKTNCHLEQCILCSVVWIYSICYPFWEVINGKGVQLDLPCPRFPAFSSCKSSLLSLNNVLPYMCLLRDGWISSPIRGETLKSAFRSILAKDQWGTFAVGGMEEKEGSYLCPQGSGCLNTMLWQIRGELLLNEPCTGLEIGLSSSSRGWDCVPCYTQSAGATMILCLNAVHSFSVITCVNTEQALNKWLPIPISLYLPVTAVKDYLVPFCDSGNLIDNWKWAIFWDVLILSNVIFMLWTFCKRW